MRARSFIAVLLSQEADREHVYYLQLMDTEAPTQIDVAARWGDADVYDVYLLAEDHDWPDTVAYRYLETVPRAPTEPTPYRCHHRPKAGAFSRST